MKIILVGNGKFSKDINKYFLKSNIVVENIEDIDETKKVSADFIVYAGSERNQNKAQVISKDNKIPIILLSTNFSIDKVNSCIYKTVNSSFEVKSFINSCLSFYNANEVKLLSIVESHQKDKKDISGTAKLLCDQIKSPYNLIKSIRNPVKQIALGIPKKYLTSHAYHKVTFKQGADTFNFEIMILGKETYIRGILKTIEVVKGRKYKIGIFNV